MGFAYDSVDDDEDDDDDDIDMQTRIMKMEK